MQYNKDTKMMVQLLDKIEPCERVNEKVNKFKDNAIIAESLYLSVINKSGFKHASIQSIAVFFVEDLLGFSRDLEEAVTLEMLITKAMSYERPAYAINKECDVALKRKFASCLHDCNVEQADKVSELLMEIVLDHNRKKQSAETSFSQSMSASNIGEEEDMNTPDDLSARFDIKDLSEPQQKIIEILRIGADANYNNLTRRATVWYNRTYSVANTCFENHCNKSLEKFLSLHPTVSQSRLKSECDTQCINK